MDKFIAKKATNGSKVLDQGRYDVNINRAVIITDRCKNLNGERKTAEELKTKGVDWTDERKVLAIVFTCKSGVITERFRDFGFARFDDLEDKEGHFKSAYEEPYAINTETNERVVCPIKSENASNILNQLFGNCQMQNEEGEWIDLMQFDENDQPTEERGIEDLIGCRLNIEVKSKSYNDKNAPASVGNFRKYGFTASGNRQLEDVTAKEQTEDQENF